MPKEQLKDIVFEVLLNPSDDMLRLFKAEGWDLQSLTRREFLADDSTHSLTVAVFTRKIKE
jgi:hypothetical protein